MQVYYFNDEKNPVVVKFRKKGGQPWEWDYRELKPAQGALFTVFGAEEGDVPFVKHWSNGTVMITCADKDSLGVSDIL